MSNQNKTEEVRRQAQKYFNKIRGLRVCFGGAKSVSLNWTDTTNIIAKVWPKSESEFAGEVVFTKKCLGGCMGDDYECELADGRTVLIYAPALVQASIWDVIKYQAQRKMNGLSVIVAE
jgi:hypothetical protein